MARGSGSERRAVYANAPKSNPERYNRQSNTKYTAWNFIPKNLMEQFRCAIRPRCVHALSAPLTRCVLSPAAGTSIGTFCSSACCS